MIPLCSICFMNLKMPEGDAYSLSSDDVLCSFCFGMLSDLVLCEQTVQKVKDEFVQNGYDGSTFLLALNTPITMHLREVIVDKLLDGAFVPVSMSPKGQFSMFLMSKINEATGLRPTLNSDLVLTLTISNDEFLKSDVDYFLNNFPKEFMDCGRKRKPSPDDLGSLYSKVKINTIGQLMDSKIASKYNMVSPTHKCTVSVRLERDATFVAGRYCKYSRTLSQSPWSPDLDTPKELNNSVSEKIGSVITKNFKADSFRFIASGREDIDVRMLGNGRPFAVQLMNARKLVSNVRSIAKDSLALLEDQINKSSLDIKVNSLARVTAKEMLILNVGQEEKRKVYSCLCYAKVPITDQMIELLRKAAPVDISQRTVIRVLKRRPLIDRKRTIFAMNACKLDDYHFSIKLETQAGTYVKEFVHSDFGRTRPSIGPLMGLKLGQVDILELDVEEVDLEWPPQTV